MTRRLTRSLRAAMSSSDGLPSQSSRARVSQLFRTVSGQPSAATRSLAGVGAHPGSACDWTWVVARRPARRVLVVCSASPGADLAVTSERSVSLVLAGAEPLDHEVEPFAVAFLDECVSGLPAERQRAAVHQAVHHLDRGGVLGLSRLLDVLLGETFAELGMTRETHQLAEDIVIYRRASRTTVHDLLWEARATIRRVTASALAAECAGPSGPLVVDTRSHTDRCRMGVIAGSIHVPRTVLEWHLDPANGYHHPAVTGLDQPLVIVCNGGYSSSLAAANLVRLGFTHVRDLIGGVRSWISHGYPVAPPDHAHLDL